MEKFHGIQNIFVYRPNSTPVSISSDSPLFKQSSPCLITVVSKTVYYPSQRRQGNDSIYLENVTIITNLIFFLNALFLRLCSRSFRHLISIKTTTFLNVFFLLFLLLDIIMPVFYVTATELMSCRDFVELFISLLVIVACQFQNRKI